MLRDSLLHDLTKALLLFGELFVKSFFIAHSKNLLDYVSMINRNLLQLEPAEAKRMPRGCAFWIRSQLAVTPKQKSMKGT